VNDAPAIAPVPVIVGDVKVLLVSVSVDTKLTNVEFAPAGSNIVFVTLALCGCGLIVCPCEFA